ncbi:MAG: CHAT domain-containing protein [Betaproteobacteria bacterium]|nr:MAG: CHAT domain-containing protein [Betaproteobacteria bacterium]
MKAGGWALCLLLAAGAVAAASPDEEARDLMRAAQGDLAVGRNADAVHKLERALVARPGEPLAADVQASLGSAYLATGRTADAERSLTSAIERARKANRQQTVVAALNDLGNLRAAQGRFAEAQSRYRDAMEAAAAAGNKPLGARASTNLARALVDDGRSAEAIGMLPKLAAELRTLPVSPDKAYGLVSVGRLYARLGDGVRSAAVLRDALEASDAANDARARSAALGYLGELYGEARRSSDALQLMQRAIASAEQADAPELLYRWQWDKARLLRTQGEADEAILAYQHAVQTFTSVRADLAASPARGSFRESVGPLFAELADLLLEQSGRLSDAKVAASYLAGARSTMEAFKGAELQDYFQDDCVAALRARTTGIDQLAPQTAALYPIILKDRLELLLTLPDGMKRFTTRVDANTLTREIRSFRLLLEKRTTHQYYPHARQLYDWLIRPIAAELERQRVDTLVIVPDGALRTIPLAALHDGQQFLVARYALATTPGLTLTDPRPLARQQVKLLLNGLSDGVQGFPPLPYVAQELEAIHALYGGRVLRDGDFTVTNMERDLEQTPYSIVHIASHGQFAGEVDKTFVLTYEDRLSMSKLEQFLGLSKFRTEPVELLTLSACETAAGDDRAALGLAGIAIKAGARSALATLWTVNDPASALLVSDFYRALRDPAISKARALQQAQLAALKDPRYRHPNYWSGFLLIGNWL